MHKYKFNCKKGYNYYIVICKNINTGLKVIEKYLKNTDPNHNHYINKNDFDVEMLPINFVELQNTVIEVASKDYIKTMYEHNILSDNPWRHNGYIDKY